MLNYTTVASDFQRSPLADDVKETIIWIDVETSGPTPETDELLEIGALITDLSGNVVSDTFESLVHVPNLPVVLAKTSHDVLDIHEESGLWFDLWNRKSFEPLIIESELINWLDESVNEDTILYFGGNSITLDRNFVRLNLPNFYKRISHRSVDVTSLSIALQSNTYVGPFKKQKAHRALLDAKDSLIEYRYYLHCMKNM